MAPIGNCGTIHCYLSDINCFPRFGNYLTTATTNHAIFRVSKHGKLPQTERHSLRCQKILWFTGVAAREKHDASDLLKVALLSAKKRAPSLVPVLIYDGPNEHPLPQWFSNRGGFVVHHNSSLIPFFEELPKNISSNLIKHQGAYLRLEIPVVMNR